MRAAASCDGLLRSRRLACTAVGGIPVRGCRAGITLAVAWRTRIRWSASWDRALAGRRAAGRRPG